MLYPFGSLYPAGYDQWSAAHGVAQKSNWVAEVATAGKEDLTALFASLDAGASGVLDTAGVTELAKKIWSRAHPDSGREPTDRKVSKIVSRLGLDGDGKLSLEVFLSTAEKMRSPGSIGEDEIAGFAEDPRASVAA